MEGKFLKSDLIRILALTLIFLAIVIFLSIWDSKTGILEQIASRWL